MVRIMTCDNSLRANDNHYREENVDKVYKENEELQVKVKMSEEQYIALQALFAEEQEKNGKPQMSSTFEERGM
ncbi:hypothetical protein R1flu_003018 [Riccia fluitans]|uniref:Uncharacterized protein n=1 Tax=Riccia fluitans TaxID=41844 RepID=A0ABD1Y7S8_9MARC